MSVRIGVDIGGTFTDLVAISPDGVVTTHKTASTPHDYGAGIIEGLRALLADRPGPVHDVLHATTVGSNTILEAKGAKTALITTRGFRDILEIRDLRMPVLYDIGWTKPKALVERRLRLEVTEKMRPDGSVAVPLDKASLDPVIAMLRAENVASVAICLLHSYANPAHEQAVAHAVQAALPDIAISVSSEILPEIKEYPRTSTTVINAYVQPVVRAYITALDARLQTLGIDAPLQLMQSNGGLPRPCSPRNRQRTSSNLVRPPGLSAVPPLPGVWTNRASSPSTWVGQRPRRDLSKPETCCARKR
jgi:N-methylhydantoinase A